MPCVPICVASLCLRAVSAMRRASAMHQVSGFSQYTCLPSCMAARLTGACMWSGVLTTTASICPWIWSSILRKSRDFRALGKALKVAAAVASSTSHRATMFCPAISLRFSPPRPPHPTTAMSSRSLAGSPPDGAWPSTVEGMRLGSVAAAAALLRNPRLV